LLTTVILATWEAVILATWEAVIKEPDPCLVKSVHKTAISKITREIWTQGVVKQQSTYFEARTYEFKPHSHPQRYGENTMMKLKFLLPSKRSQAVKATFYDSNYIISQKS
jgi:hypothetical protein